MFITLFYGARTKNLITCKGDPTAMAKSFKDWWATVPADLQKKVKGNDDWNANKPLLNQINYVLMAFNTSGKHSMMPSHSDLQSWIKNGEIDVLRMKK
jgi:hypothetical protein